MRLERDKKRWFLGRFWYLPSVSKCLILSAKVSPDIYLIDHNSITPSDFQEQQMMARRSSESQGWLWSFYIHLFTPPIIESIRIMLFRQCCPHRDSWASTLFALEDLRRRRHKGTLCSVRPRVNCFRKSGRKIWTMSHCHNQPYPTISN